MSRALALTLACGLLSGCELLTGDFRLTGTVELAPALSERAPKTNTMLFVVAKNAGGVPVAVHSIINPEFPAAFEMDQHDLLVPALRRQEPLSLHAEFNTHGAAGAPRSGDFAGRAASEVRSGARGIRVLVDRQL
ncbi:MAG TPA: hypothetical protein DCZ01_07560 [Elusimicrobia bacterium]|nr:MAG: hypothetical protein A2X37_03285 [Elusimicrobia bacterium GWA2_66_18]OGR70339.1 MAG: hypothetical protein A2X40_04175 [Elusimicrobia bacterium GWC2_65_9]HAZ08361.1 hypothetical protein [Elusimicrobiota bacterium]